MERVLVICLSAAVGTGFFFWFSRALGRESVRSYVAKHPWLLHPNSICYWRTGMAGVGFFLYFFSSFQSWAIFIFTFAAILDGVDGLVARKCGLQSRWGEWLDPLCDKLTYLPPMFGFAFSGIISLKLVWILAAVELSGQFFARHILAWMKRSGAANNFGKIKAIICFGLVILCALLDSHPGVIVNMADAILWATIILSAASMVFKFIPNRLYADILSSLNFCCGAASLVLTHHGYFAWAICVIIMGQLFDLFDGRMALKHGGTKYGPFMDDIADFVSFGLAPAYVVVKSGGGGAAWLVAAVFVGGVAFRLVRFVLKDKHRTDLPEGVFNGLPSPAGALMVLGAALVAGPWLLWVFTLVSTGLMISHIRFAHFGRVILKQVPKPLFFLISAAVIIVLAYIIKTRDIEMFGYLILGALGVYMLTARAIQVPGGADQGR